MTILLAIAIWFAVLAIILCIADVGKRADQGVENDE